MLLDSIQHTFCCLLQEDYGGTECQRCPTGFITEGPGSDSATDCFGKNYVNITVNITCTNSSHDKQNLASQLILCQ